MKIKAIIVFTFCSLPSLVAASEFYRIGGVQDENGEIKSQLDGLSADGSLVLGDALGASPWIWSPSQGIMQPSGFEFSGVRALSADGKTVVGAVVGEDGARPAYWTAEIGIQEIAPLPGYRAFSASDISDDGKTILGSGWTSDDVREPWLWSQDVGFQLLGHFPGVSTRNGVHPSDLSGNGEFVSGIIIDDATGERRAFIWGREDGFALLPEPDLGPKDGYPPNTKATDTYGSSIANDGTVVGFAPVGPTRGPNRVASSVVWYPDGRTTVVGILTDHGHNTSISDTISNDRRFVFGRSFYTPEDGPNNEHRAFVWTEGTGIQELERVLRQEYGLTEMHPWGLGSVKEISDDRRVLAGLAYEDGIAASGYQREAWAVYLDWPLGSIRADFNLDDVLDESDADQLVSAIVKGSQDPLYDLNGDELVSANDLDTYLVQNSRLNGDADFSGQVEFADFLTLSSNFGNDAMWSEGDFDANGSVEFPDFLILSNNFGASAPAMSVPEPIASTYAAFFCLTLLMVRRRNR